MTVELIFFTQKGAALAAILAQKLTQAGHPAACTRAGLSLEDWTARAFARAGALVFVGAAGIAVRAIAPHLRHKAEDPAVVVMDEAGCFAIPILSGHLGGANDLARLLASFTGGRSVITTATDVNGVFSFDQWARDLDCAVPYPDRILPVARNMLAGKRVNFWSQWPVEGEAPAGVEMNFQVYPDVKLTLQKGAENFEETEKKPLILVPRTVFLGIGCRRNVELENLEEAYNYILKMDNLFPESVKMASSINIKAEEPALLAFCHRHSLPLRTFTAAELSRAEGGFTSSEFVQAVTGVDNVCERAAVLAAGNGRLLRPKIARNGVAMALAAVDFAPRWRNFA